MSAYIKIILQILWMLVLGYWLYAAVKAKKAVSQESLSRRFLFYWLPLLFAVYLLGPGAWFGHTWLRENFVPHTDPVGIMGLVLCLAGTILACWSRYLLSDNWSLSVQKKEKHELVEQGPYKLVRHPIYTGLLLLFSGNALIVGDYRGIVAVGLVFVSFWYKLKKEEKWLKEIFGNEYRAYEQRTKALFPWIL